MSANTITGLVSTIYEALDTVSRELVGFIPAVNKDGQASRAAVGQVVRSPVVPAMASENITPSNQSPNSAGIVVGNVDVTITKAKAVPFNFNGTEVVGMSTAVGVAPYATTKAAMIAQAIRTLANEVETDLATTALLASRAYGIAGTTPFATSGDFSDVTQTLKILKDNGAPQTDLRMVLNTTAGAQMMGKQSNLFKVSEAGTDSMLREGVIGRIMGLATGESGAIGTFVKGTMTGALVNNGAGLAVGATSVPFDTGTGGATGFKAGDVITFAGDTVNKYIVVTGLNAAAGTITIAAPGIRVAIADNAAITVGNNYTPSTVFHKGAFQLAARLPELPEGGDAADDRQTIFDPVSGLPFEFAVYRQYRQVRYEVALAWGTSAIASRHAATLLG
jgi:hypothetical protein